MGLLVDGIWQDRWYETKSTGGRFERQESRFRHFITADGAPGPTGSGGFAASAGRYHLYVSLACPWAHRTLIMRALKGLEDKIGLSVVHWHMGEKGWSFAEGPGVIADTVNGAAYIHELYQKAEPRVTSRATVPVLWDRQRGTIVSNESAEIIRMMNTAFDGVGARPGDYYPEALRGEIDAVNTRVYETVNNGVYRAGFATTQAAYDEAIGPLFDSLDWLEKRLEGKEHLVGERLTEADIRLFTTLIRFDPVYAIHFKCSRRRIADHPNLARHTRALLAMPEISRTVDMDHIRRHYFESHPTINPSGVVAVMPDDAVQPGRG